MGKKKPQRFGNSHLNLNDAEIENKAKKILSKMSLKQKAYQMSGDKSILLGIIPMMIHYNKNPIPAGKDENLGIPGVMFADGPRGVVLNNSTCFPVSMARGATWDPALEEKVGNIIGIESRAQGANFFGGVCINLLRHPAWGRAQETYGEDPHLLGIMGRALVKGTQKHVMACAKHYACNSMENARFKINVFIDERSLREIYLPHFKACIDEGVASIMNAYNKVNGKYCGHNEHLLRDILKDEWGFKGFVITDFIFGIRDGKKAVKAGVDIEMPFKWRMKPKKIVKWVKKGEISEELIDDAVLRILRQKLRFETRINSEQYNRDMVSSEEHISVALEVARKSLVLLKNKNDILPIEKSSTKMIAVIGELANRGNIGDLGSSQVYPSYIKTPLEGIKNLVGDEVEILYQDGSNRKETVDLVKKVDYVIIVVGYTEKEEGEYVFTKGGDRDSLRLKKENEELISLLASNNKNCIVVMEGGSSIITEKWRSEVSAIIMAWYPGMEGGSALAEILLGKINPSGKLPCTFPKSQSQLPFFDKSAKFIEYDLYPGYRFLDKHDYTPAYYFGHGLSYTEFEYSDLKLNKKTLQKGEELTVNINITNKGNRDGEEIVQMYTGYNNSSVERSKKELKGFKRVYLKAGETKRVLLKLDSSELAYYDTEDKDWKIELIEYIVLVGPSSNPKDLLTSSFKII